MFSILCRIKCKYHRVHLTELMGKHETTYIYSILCLSLINTHTSRYKSESNARKFLARGFGTKHWSSYIKLISLNQLFYLNISTSIFKASFDERDYCHFTKKKKNKKKQRWVSWSICTMELKTKSALLNPKFSYAAKVIQENHKGLH